MNLLELIWWVSVGFLILSLCAWVWLFIMHVMAKRRLKRREEYQDVWMTRLLSWVESDGDEVELPQPTNSEELEAVLLQIRDLAENFKGSYRKRLTEALDRVGARSYAIKQLRSVWSTQRANAAAMLNWCSTNDELVAALEKAMDDPSAIVRLEAAIGLARKNRLRDPENVLKSLCRDHAAESLVARDVFKIWGEVGDEDWAALFKQSWPTAGWVLLLEAVGASGNPEWIGLIAQKANDPHEEVACAALEALEGLGYPDAGPVIMRACAHAAPRVRRHAALALRACSVLDDAKRPLIKLLEDDDFEVRKTALECLITMGGQSLLNHHQPKDYWQEQLFEEFAIKPIAAS